MLNSIGIQGRLPKDPELRHSPSGIPVTSFTIACERSYVRQGMERQVDWIDVVAWRQTAEFVCNYFHKGSMIVLDGQLQTRTYKDKDGNNHKAYEVYANHVFFGEKEKRERDEFNQSPPDDYFSQIDSDGEDLPF